MIYPTEETTAEEAAAMFASLQAFGARRHLHLKSVSKSPWPSEVAISSSEYDALGFTGDRTVDGWLTIIRCTWPSIVLEGPPVPPGATCDYCRVPDPPSLAGYSGQMLCPFCEHDWKRGKMAERLISSAVRSRQTT